MLIRDILTTKGGEIYDIAPEQPIPEAVHLMVKQGIGSLVVKANEVMVGLITERDIVVSMSRYGCDVSGCKVSEFMNTEPIIGSPEDSVDYVRGVMIDNRITHLPVMGGDQLLGIISFHDVAKACLSDASFENLLLKRYIKQWPG